MWMFGKFQRVSLQLSPRSFRVLIRPGLHSAGIAITHTFDAIIHKFVVANTSTICAHMSGEWGSFPCVTSVVKLLEPLEPSKLVTLTLPQKIERDHRNRQKKLSWWMLQCNVPSSKESMRNLQAKVRESHPPSGRLRANEQM